MSRKKGVKLEKTKISITDADIADAGKVATAAVTKADFAREFGEQNVTTHPDGTWDGRLRTYRDMKKFDEMDQARVRADIERGYRQNAAVRDVVLRTPEGQPVIVPEHHAANIARLRGLHEPARYGGQRVQFDHDGVVLTGPWRGHTHVGAPWPHQLSACPVCREMSR